jgi:hypothetical protein
MLTLETSAPHNASRRNSLHNQDDGMRGHPLRCIQNSRNSGLLERHAAPLVLRNIHISNGDGKQETSLFIFLCANRKGMHTGIIALHVRPHAVNR